MIGIQIVAILFALWMVYFTFLHFRRGEFNRTEVTFWMLLWAGLVAVVLFPNSVRFINQTFSISRTFDLVVIVGMIILYAVAFRTYVVVHRIQRSMADIVRREALEESKRVR